MSKRTYPYYAGRTKYRGSTKQCECCEEAAPFVVCIQTSIFRGDDLEYLVCENHARLARLDYATFCMIFGERQHYMRQTISAQHEETGRQWKGERRALPPRYQELSVSEEG